MNELIQTFNFGINEVRTAIKDNGGVQQIAFVNEPNLYRVIFRSSSPIPRLGI